MMPPAVVSREKKAGKPAFPTESLETDIARAYTYIHPALLLAHYAFRFGSIVADPVRGLTVGLVLLSILQAGYVNVCLPVTGGRRPAPGPSKGGGRRMHGASKGEPGSRRQVFTAILSLVFAIIVGTPVFFILLILFGAPITTHLVETALCAAHVSVLTTMPLAYLHGVDGEKWRQISAIMLPVDAVFGGAIGTLLGAWVGAVPIPLDWDREWQRWPVTIVTGAYVGYAAGKVLGGTVFNGTKIRFD